MKGKTGQMKRKVAVLIVSTVVMLILFFAFVRNIIFRSQKEKIDNFPTTTVNEELLMETTEKSEDGSYEDNSVSGDDLDNDTEANTTASYISDSKTTEIATTIETPSSTEERMTTAWLTTATTEQTTSQQYNLASEVVTEHVHSFVTEVTYVYHPEEGHYEEVCVAQGYEEEIYVSYDTYCYYCGAIMDEWSFSDLLDHSAIHGAYGTYEEVIDVIWHQPIYEERWVVDVKEYNEEVIVERCSTCGYIK